MPYVWRLPISIVLLSIGAYVASAVSESDYRAIEVDADGLSESDEDKGQKTDAVEQQQSVMVPRSRLIRQEQAPASELEMAEEVVSDMDEEYDFDIDGNMIGPKNKSNNSNSTNSTNSTNTTLTTQSPVLAKLAKRTYIFNYNTDRSKHDKNAITKAGDWLDPYDVPDLLKGVVGAHGRVGPPGAQGPPGPQGKSGWRGYPGVPGSVGSNGTYKVEEPSDEASKGNLVLLIVGNLALVGGLYLVLKSTHRHDGVKGRHDAAEAAQSSGSRVQIHGRHQEEEQPEAPEEPPAEAGGQDAAAEGGEAAGEEGGEEAAADGEEATGAF